MSTTESSPAETMPAINPAEEGSAATMFDLGRIPHHPAETVLGVMLRARAVGLPDGHCYRLGADLSLGRVGIGPEDDTGFVLTDTMPLRDFLRLCARLSYTEVYDIGRGKSTCSVEQRRARARLARTGAGGGGRDVTGRRKNRAGGSRTRSGPVPLNGFPIRP